VFWGTLAYTLIGGTLAGTILTLVFLPAMYAIWFKITPTSGQVPEPDLSQKTYPDSKIAMKNWTGFDH
jgi:hypothetical protein